MRITIGFCTDNLEKDRDFMENMKSKCGLDVDFIPKVGYTSICKAYNEILDGSENDIIIFCHNDVGIKTDNFGKIISELFVTNPKYGIIGLVGSNGWTGGIWLGNNGAEPVGRLVQCGKYKISVPKYTVFSPYLSENPLVPVCTIDGMFMAVHRKRIKVNFDENLTGFHFYDVMFSIDNALKDCKVGVTYKILAIHESDGMLNEKWHKEQMYSWAKYGKNVSFINKLPWGGRAIIKKYENE